MNRSIVIVVHLLGLALFATPLGTTGWLLAGTNGALSFALVGGISWPLFYLAKNFQKVRANHYVVWERMGKFHCVSRAGITVPCFPPYIDRSAINGGNGDFEYHSIRIESGENGIEVDFKGGGTGTPIGEINYRVIDGECGIPPIDGAYRFTYVVADTANRIKSLVLGALCQELQQHTVEEARDKLELISRKVRDAEEDDETLGNLGIRTALLEMGVELHPTRGVVLEDIRYDQRTIDNRQAVQAASMRIQVETLGVQEAEQKALQQKKLATGTSSAIRAIFNAGKTKDPSYTWEMAEKTYLSQQALEVLRTHNSANLTLVGRGIEDVITSVRVGEGGRSHAAAG